MRASAGSARPWSASASACAVWNITLRACSAQTVILASWRRISGMSIRRWPKARRCCEVDRLGDGAAHQAGRAHAVGQARVVDHVGHLLEAAAALAHQPGGGAFQADLAAGHGAGAELVLQPQDAVAVAAAVVQLARQQEQRHALQAGLRLAARQHHGEAGVGVGAEPLVAAKTPAAVRPRLGHDLGGADIGARALLGHEHGALAQAVEVQARDLRQHLVDEFRRAELAQRARQRIGHADRAAQAELGLHEQMAERVLGRCRHGLGPAQRAAAMRQRGQAESL